MDRRIIRAYVPVLIIALCLIFPMRAQAQDVSGCPISPAKAVQSWDSDCAASIEGEPDSAKKAELHFRRAYVLNGREAYQEALDDLNAACTMVPHHAKYLHERAYTLNSLGRYQEALADLDEQAILEPQAPTVYQERAFTRTLVGDWEGALADRDRQARLLPDSRSALIARANARLWLGQFDHARQDLKAAAALKPDAPGSTENAGYFERVSALLEAWTHHSFGHDPAARCRHPNQNDYSRTTLIGDCTLAFLSAKSPKDKADALTNRAIAWDVARQSQHDATIDCQAAVALDPGNPHLHTNLGFAYLQAAHSWAARQEFDRSIEIERTYLALAGRAQADYNLGEKERAFRDAKESFEMQSNAAALWVLGDISKDRGDDASAKLYWMGAYHLGLRDDRLMERLQSVGVRDPAKEPSGKSQR
jgi:tetratricopeptide (TPR) repeat protein